MVSLLLEVDLDQNVLPCSVVHRELSKAEGLVGGFNPKSSRQIGYSSQIGLEMNLNKQSPRPGQ